MEVGRVDIPIGLVPLKCLVTLSRPNCAGVVPAVYGMSATDGMLRVPAGKIINDESG